MFRLFCFLLFIGLPLNVYARALISDNGGNSWKTWGPNQNVVTAAQSVDGYGYAATYDGRVFRQASYNSEWKLLFDGGFNNLRYSFPDVIIPLKGVKERFIYGSYSGVRAGFWIFNVKEKSFEKLIDGAVMDARLLEGGRTLLATTWNNQYLINLDDASMVVEFSKSYRCFNPHHPNELYRMINKSNSNSLLGKKEYWHSLDFGKSFPDKKNISLSGLVDGSRVTHCGIPEWKGKGTIYVLAQGAGTGFFLTRDSGEGWEWVQVDERRNEYHIDKLYFHPLAVGNSYLLSNGLKSFYIIENYNSVKKKVSNFHLRQGEDLKTLVLDPVNPKRLILIITPFHDI